MRGATATAAALYPGDHVCWLFDDEDGYLDALAGYAAGGVAAGQKIVHYTDGAGDIDDGLARRGVDLVAARERGQYESIPIDVEATFDPVAYCTTLVDVTAEAVAQGYPAVRFAGDMTWSLGHLPADELVGYESMVNTVYATTAAIGLCLYDRRRFSPEVLAATTHMHPDTAAPDLPGDRPMVRLVATDQPLGLRIDGELDLSNSGCLHSVLADLLARADGRPVEIDVSRLSFTDLAGVRAITRFGEQPCANVRLVGATAILRRLIDAVAPTAVTVA